MFSLVVSVVRCLCFCGFGFSGDFGIWFLVEYVWWLFGWGFVFIVVACLRLGWVCVFAVWVWWWVLLWLLVGVSCGLWVWWLGSGVWLLVFGLLASVVCVGACCGLVVVFVVLFPTLWVGFPVFVCFV